MALPAMEAVSKGRQQARIARQCRATYATYSQQHTMIAMHVQRESK